jgi:hypothetical protein
MDRSDHHALAVERLTGRPGSPCAGVVRPDFEGCADLDALVLAVAPFPDVRRERWERRPEGLTVVIGGEYTLLLGLDFPAGERAGPDEAWIRGYAPTGAIHWRIAKQQAAWIWLLLKRATAAGAVPQSPGHYALAG